MARKTPRKIHCMKSAHIQSYSGPHFHAFRLNAERYGVYLHIQSECRKMWTRITPNMQNFYAVISALNKRSYFYNLHVLCTRRKSKDGLTKNIKSCKI